jgi:hypothetical protein
LAEEQRVAAEELAAEAEAKRRADKTALADTQAREAARLKEEAEAKQLAEAEAREKARFAAEQEQQPEERARADGHERARVVAEEEGRQAEQKVEEEAAANELVTEVLSQPQPPAGKEAMSLAAPEVPLESTPREEPQIEGRKAITSIPEATEDGEGEDTQVDEAKPCRERAPVSPEDRGGRSRATVPKKEGGSEKKRHPRAAKPEIVCLKRQREWVLAVELPEDFPQGQSVTVTQGGNPLEKDETEIDCWRLAQLSGEIIVRVLEDGDERLFKLPLGDEDCLIFKLCGDDRNRGRHVKSPSSGSCLAVVPEEWKRDEELAGAPPYEPEEVRLPGHRAHFFEL